MLDTGIRLICNDLHTKYVESYKEQHMRFPSLDKLFGIMVIRGAQEGAIAAAKVPHDASTIPMSVRVHPRVRVFYEAEAEACGVGSASAMVAMVLEGVMQATVSTEQDDRPKSNEKMTASNAPEGGAMLETSARDAAKDLRDPFTPLGAVLNETGVNVVTFDQPGGFWVKVGLEWSWRDWPELDAVHLAELVKLGAAAVWHLDFKGVTRGSLSKGIRLEVLRPPIAPHPSGALAFRISSHESYSLEDFFATTDTTRWNQPIKSRPLAPVLEDVGLRLKAAVDRQENILLCSPPLWERIELVETFIRSIPAGRRVVIIEDRDQRDPRIRSDILPRNSIVLTYVRGTMGAEFADAARAAEAFRPDYIVVPNLCAAHKNDFSFGIADVFRGQIVATNAHESDETFTSTADVVIKVVSDQAAPMGVGEVHARPLR